MFAVISLGVYIFAALKLSLATDGSCRPIIGLHGHNKGFPIGSTAVLDCQIKDCNAVTSIKFELKGFASTWVTIYEYSGNATKGSDLEYEYAVLDSRHLLEIKTLTLHHHGLFKCIINDGSNGCYESNKLELNINVIPGKVGILPKAPNLVQHQVHRFTCSGEGIHPEPDVVWVLNGVRYRNGSVANEQRDDGLWSVNNSIQLSFDEIRKNTLACTMKTTTGDRWIQDSVTFFIKDAAKVLFPIQDVSMTTESTSTFTLNCRGTGYKPTIIWEKDGVNIQADGSKFVIKHYCTSTTCNGSLTSTQIRLPLHHGDVGSYDGVYKCIIALQPPYKSTDLSSNTHINVLYFAEQEHFDEPSMLYTSIILDAILIALVLIGAASLIFIWIRKKKKQRRKRLSNSKSQEEAGAEKLIEPRVTDADIKTAKVDEAVRDSDDVLKREPENMKDITTAKADEAIRDSDDVLKREPENMKGCTNKPTKTVNKNGHENMFNEALKRNQKKDTGKTREHINMAMCLLDKHKNTNNPDSGMESNYESEDDTGNKSSLIESSAPDAV